ncbi:MAG: nicotinate-nicotinamide nucleotide adenylyltransferase, partial [Clostridia bacterium]|nr:nicotinate-nicotinamide nucleotide adenylyltransferase [Clostridia bacterium]
LRGKYHGDELWFIIGQDNLAQMPQWHDFTKLCGLCGFAAGLRPGCGTDPVLQAQKLREEYGARIVLLPFVGPDVSSTAIREMVLQGHDITPYVGENVANYIRKEKLYGRTDTTMG